MIDLVAEQSALGGLERWLNDASVTEVIVNAGREVWVERAGRLEHVGSMRSDTLLAAIERILLPIGRRLDRSSPVVDARLPDGSRMCAVLQPIAVDGPCVTIRRFAVQPVPLTAFATQSLVELLHDIVRHRCNVLISGPTSSGKTTLLNALCGSVARDERIITLEDIAELRLPHPHVVRLETRAATPDGVGDITMVDLVHAALRLRPDRLVVGEVRGAEAVALLQALNTGHDGSLATIHANSSADALARVASLVLHDAPNWPLAAIREHVRRAIDVVVHVSRGVDGARRVAEVAEVVCDASATGENATRSLMGGDGSTSALARGRTAVIR